MTEKSKARAAVPRCLCEEPKATKQSGLGKRLPRFARNDEKKKDSQRHTPLSLRGTKVTKQSALGRRLARFARNYEEKKDPQ